VVVGGVSGERSDLLTPQEHPLFLVSLGGRVAAKLPCAHHMFSAARVGEPVFGGVSRERSYPLTPPGRCCGQGYFCGVDGSLRSPSTPPGHRTQTTTSPTNAPRRLPVQRRAAQVVRRFHEARPDEIGMRSWSQWLAGVAAERRVNVVGGVTSGEG